MTLKGKKQVRRTPAERAKRRRAYERGYRRKQSLEGHELCMPSKGEAWPLIDELHAFIDEVFEGVDEDLHYEEIIRTIRNRLDHLEAAVGECENVLAVTPNPRCDLQVVHQIADNWRFQWEQSDNDPGQKGKPFTMFAVMYLDDLTSLIYKYFFHLAPTNIDHYPEMINRYPEAKDMAVSPTGGILDFAKQLLAAAVDRIDELKLLRDDLDGEPDYRYVKNRKK